MFVDAIEKVSQYIRPLLTLSRFYSADFVQRGAATLFFVNRDGWAVTCRHVASTLVAAEELSSKRQAFLQEIEELASDMPRKKRREIERKHGFSRSSLFEVYNRFINCYSGDAKIQIKSHPSLDLALLHFGNSTASMCKWFPVFAEADLPKSGKYLCRIGYPFAEFSNFTIDTTQDRVIWTNEGRMDTPWFPIEGMVTRHIVNDGGEVVGFEMSTPGLRGQSGGPVFDSEGKIWGMQVSTTHLDLDFDVDQKVVRNGSTRQVSDSAFLHVGRCIHVGVMKRFMSENGVKFETDLQDS